MGENGHVIRHWSHAGGIQAAGVGVFHYAETAGSVGFEIRVMTQGGNRESVRHGRIENRDPWLARQVFSVDAETDGFQNTTPLFKQIVLL
jgi:hypothetical protein